MSPGRRPSLTLRGIAGLALIDFKTRSDRIHSKGIISDWGIMILDMRIEDCLDEIQKIEPAFIEAGKIAVEMQRNISPKKKFDTGTYDVDVVTEADFAVQKAVLSTISKTELVQCRLIDRRGKN